MVLKFKSITQFIRIPACCPLCQQLHRAKEAVCANCRLLLTPIKSPCARCAFPLVDSGHGLCGRCIKQPPAFDKIYSHYQFDDLARQLIHQYKYHHALYLRDFLAHLILDGLKEIPQYPDCLIPVPLHPVRIRERGFNQSAELAKKLGKLLHIPVNTGLCLKQNHTLAQASLNASQRQNNLKKSFQSKPCPYPHVAIIDDLLTTGSTAQALASILKKNGAERVDVWCCARAVV